MLAQIQEIDGQLSHAIESYNLANVKLDRIKGELKTNSQHLTIARSSLKAAQSHLSERLVALYKGGGSGGTLEVILAARSVDDLLNRIDAVDRVSAQDARVLREVKSFRAQVIERKGRLERAQRSQVQVVADKAAQRSSIEGQLAERQRLLSTIKDQIASLEAAERRRQERLAAQAQARLRATQQQAVRPRRRRRRSSSRTRSRKRSRPHPTPATAASSGSRCSTSASRTSGAARARPASTAPASSCTSTPRSASRCRTTRPRSTAWARPSRATQLQAGDLVFFNGLGHAGIYIGGGQFIHAPHSGDVVKISSLSDSWYARTWVGARRI